MRVATALGVTAAFFPIIVLCADQHPQFAFDRAVVFVGVIHDFFANFDVFLERLVAGVNHHTGEAFINTFLAQLEGIAMVEVDGDGNVGEADGGFDEFLEIDRIGVLARALGDLEHQRRFFLLASLNDGLDQLHVVDVEGAEGVFAVQGFGEQVAGMCQWHNFLIP